MSENKIYYIEGSIDNPEGVKQALLKVCPDVENINTFKYENEDYLYYVINNKIDYAWDKSHKILLREIGIELQPIVTKDASQFRLPTMEEFKKLNNHFSRCNSDCLEFLNSTFQILIFPAMGYRVGFFNYYEGIEGHYWSSTASVNENDSGFAYSMNFHDYQRRLANCDCNNGYSVRLVSDEPFEGGILFDGIWWKPENEEGYYSWEEALEKFNK